MKLKILSILLFSVLFGQTLKAQDMLTYFEPKFITITHLHGFKDVNKAEWLAIEEEFFNKVIKKNPYINHYEFLKDYHDESNPEFMIVKVFNSWEDINKSIVMNEELIKEAWPDEDKRKEFFKKQNALYDLYYSNEILVTTPMTKYRLPYDERSKTNPMLFYVLYNKLADYGNEDSLEAYRKYIKNVTYNNTFVKSYIGTRHYFGPDSRDFLEFYIVDSYEDLLKSFDKDKELFRNMIPDQKERDAFIETYYKGIEKVRNALYINTPTLSK